MTNTIRGFACATLALAGATILPGCATKLVVVEEPRDRGATQFEGVVVNQRASYEGTAKLNLPKEKALVGDAFRTPQGEPSYLVFTPGTPPRKDAAAEKPGEMKLEISPDAGWIDHASVLVVGLSRDWFASGKLKLKLDDRQVVKEIGVTATIGTTDAIGTVSTLLEDRKKIVESRKKKDDE